LTRPIPGAAITYPLGPAILHQKTTGRRVHYLDIAERLGSGLPQLADFVAKSFWVMNENFNSRSCFPRLAT
jgi:hypothetical protein